MSYQPPCIPPPTTYTIVLRGSPFHLSSSQIRTDSPNHFTGVFLGGNGGCSVYHSDRRPIYFDLVVEWLSGYDDFLVRIQPRDGSSELQALEALKAEAEYFKLNGLVQRVDDELASCVKRAVALDKGDRAAPTRTLLWPTNADRHVEDFRSTIQDGDSCPTEVMRGASSGPSQLFEFAFLEVRFDCFFTDNDDDLPEVSVVFGDEKLRKATQTYEGTERRTIQVDISKESSQGASTSIDGASMSLDVLLRWIVNPTAKTSKIPALRPLVDYFHPELTPREPRVVTIRVHSAIGHWSHGRLRLAHLSIRSQDQGYLRLA